MLPSQPSRVKLTLAHMDRLKPTTCSSVLELRREGCALKDLFGAATTWRLIFPTAVWAEHPQGEWKRANYAIAICFYF